MGEGGVGTVALLVHGCQLKGDTVESDRGRGARLGTGAKEGHHALHGGSDLHSEGRGSGGRVNGGQRGGVCFGTFSNLTPFLFRDL